MYCTRVFNYSLKSFIFEFSQFGYCHHRERTVLNSMPGYVSSEEEEEVAYPTPHILILKAETRIPSSLPGLAKHRADVVLRE